MTPIANAPLTWAKEQSRHLAALNEQATVKHPHEAIQYVGQAATEALAVLDDLKGDHGRGRVTVAESLFRNAIETADRATDVGLGTADLEAATSQGWVVVCGLLEFYTAWVEELRGFETRLPTGRLCQANRAIVVELEGLSARLRDLIRYVIVAAPEWNLTVPDHLAAQVWTVRISPWAYLRAMANLFWSALRHPLSETTIDLSTGRILYRS